MKFRWEQNSTPSPAHNPRPDPLQTGIIEKPRALGYTVQWLESEGESYVPRGLADDAGDGPSYTNYGIRITW